jgi:hypothetical protein
MEQIFETNDKFPFNALTIGKPVSVSGGNFFIRYSLNEKPLYIQPPKCSIKQIFIKTGKKMYCDFVFHQENEQFIRWMENLENLSQQMIFDHREKWFESELELHDIENSFTSPLKIYKSGKSYIVRTNIPTVLGKPGVKIYDEDENDLLFDQIKENTNVMVILEIQGIRCSSRSFQIDIELKQMMVLKPDNLFNTCILKKKTVSNDSFVPIVAESVVIEQNNNSVRQSIKEPVVVNHTEDLGEKKDSSFVFVKDDTPPVENILKESSVSDEMVRSLVSEEEKETEGGEKTPIKINTDGLANDLCEVDFNLEEMSDTDRISIKQRKDVYYEMYREARQKAKVARDLALSAYLEAKRIKNTYMLDDVESSDEDDEDEDDEEDEDEDDENENENKNENEEKNEQ